MVTATGVIADNKLSKDTAIANSAWKDSLGVLKQYRTISVLILSIAPVVSVVGFLGISATGAANYAMGASRMQDVVTGSIGALVVAIVWTFLAPPIMTFLDGAWQVSQGGRYGVMAQFGTIITLVLGFVPVVYNASLLGVMGFLGYRGVQSVRGGMSGGHAMAA